MTAHSLLQDTGQADHYTIDNALETLQEVLENIPIEVTGARDTPEEALANLLTALDTLGLITDSTTAT